MTNSLILVPFADGAILTLRERDNISVVLKPVCETIGLDWESQRQRIERHPVLSATTCITQVVGDSGLRPTMVMTLEGFHGFLLTVHPDRIEDLQVRDRVIAYQKRAFRVVFEHFHGAMRISAPKRASISDFLRVGVALKAERNRVIRLQLWLLLDEITDSMGLPRTARAIGYDEPDSTDLLNEFWQAISALEEAKIVVNQSRRNDLIAVNLPMLRGHFAEVGIVIDIDQTMMDALRQSNDPRFVAASKVVNCHDGKTRNCWVFSMIAA